jgi:hypothetical protein
MLRRLRLGNLRKLSRHRCGPILPDDDAGREYLRELLLVISVGPNAAVRMPKAIEVWAPWMGQQEAVELVDDINRTPIWQRKPNGKVIGDRLQVINAQRERLKLWTIAACDMSQEQAQEWRKAKHRERQRKLRQLRGAKPQASSTNQAKPWLALGISRAIWYRRETDSCAELETGVRTGVTGVRNRETTSCEIKLIKAEHESVSPELVSPPKKRRAAPLAQTMKPNTPTKAQKLKRQRPASVDATAPPAQRTKLSQVEPDTSPGATKTEQELLEMVTVLRKLLGNQATNGDWREHMKIHSKWSKSSFDRRLRILKQRRWVRIVGDANANLDRAPWGSLFEVTEIAPGSSAQAASGWCLDVVDVGKAAREQLERLERLKRGSPPAA